MTYFRARHSGWYQVPVLYDWWDLAASGATDDSELVAGNGHGNGHGRVLGDVGCAARRAQPRSSGAIVRPASLSCSQ